MAKRRRERRSRMLQICVDKDARDLPIPSVHYPGDVGFDLFVASDTTIPPGPHLPPTDVPTGIRIKAPEGTWATITPRSSTYLRYPMLRFNSAPIDCGYTGNLAARVQNIGKKPVTVRRGDPIAPLGVLPPLVAKVLSV